MADMVNQTLTQLLAPSPPRSSANRAADGGAPAREPFAKSLDRSMARPERPNDASNSARANTGSPAASEATRNKTTASAKPADTAPAAARESTTNTSTDASAADATNDTETAATAEAATTDTDATDATLAAAAIQPTDTTASLAATPAALAAASANPATAGTSGESFGPAAHTIDGLETAVSDGTTRKSRAGAGRTPLESDLTAQEASSDTRASRSDAADAAPGKLRATSFTAHLDARLEASAGGGRPAELMTALSGSNAANTLVPTGIHMPAADRPQALQAALPMHVNTPASQAGWADAVGNRVLWLVGRDESRAELILTPPSLGKLEISITVSGDTTTAQFMAATPAAREALEQAMPRLREMFEQAGVTLTESNVNTAPQDQSGGRESSDGKRNGQGGESETSLQLSRQVGGPWLQRGEGMIDIFA